MKEESLKDLEPEVKKIGSVLLNTQMKSFNEEVRKIALNIITLCGTTGSSLGYGGVAITNLSKLFNEIKKINHPVFMPQTVTQFDVMEAVIQILNEHHKFDAQLVYELGAGFQLRVKWDEECAVPLKKVKYDDYSSFF
jgi:hypothetical protein